MLRTFRPRSNPIALVRGFSQQQHHATLDQYKPADLEVLPADSTASPEPTRTQNHPRPTNQSFSMVIPPPNVTGQLHLGHALTVSIQDSLVRWRRMCGDDVLWVPGLDHAGIATQTVVEKRIARDTGHTRHEIGRDAFLHEASKWHDQYSGTITHQLKRVGAALNWDRFAYTLDEPRSTAVVEAFVRLHDKGLIYKKPRMVNWCPTLATVISDLEVDHVELNKKTSLRVPGRGKPIPFGVLHAFAYKVDGLPHEELVVKTTRLETMLGDEAVAIHPDDPRYTHLHGRFVVHPINGRKLPIVCDPVLVNMEFGTGAVKITPAHDPNDFLCAERHGLPFVTILNDDGTLNENCQAPEFVGVDRFEARRRLVGLLEEQGHFRGEEDHAMSIGTCSRSGDIVEPMLKPQWFVKCDGMSKRALDIVDAGDVSISPQHEKQSWARWLNDPRDWCISRQLWWGHRIPAYKVVFPEQGATSHDTTETAPCDASGTNKRGTSVDDDANSEWIIARSEDDAWAQALVKHQLASREDAPFVLEQDPDVLDTWFSSALFPLTALGWPHGDGAHGLDAQLQHHYPLKLMETGSDILFFWVARMAMMCTELVPEAVPFKSVYLHPMVRDKDGRKMSKSLGNVIDPLHVIQGVPLATLVDQLHTGNLDPKEVKRATKQLKSDFPEGIPECGADALRVALISYMQQGRTINLDVGRVVTSSHFCNKMWNAQKFVDRSIDLMPAAARELCDFSSPSSSPYDIDAGAVQGKTLPQKWILHELSSTTAAVERHIMAYEFAAALDAAQRFFLDDFCATYLELTKAITPEHVEEGRPGAAQEMASNVAVLRFVMDCSVRMFHPFMPFLTDHLWKHNMARSNQQLLDERDTLSSAMFPTANLLQRLRAEEKARHMEVVNNVAYALRGLREDAMRIMSNEHAGHGVLYLPDTAEESDDRVCVENFALIQFMAKMHNLELVRQPPSGNALTRYVEGKDILVTIPVRIEDESTVQGIDKELARLEKKRLKLVASVDKLNKKMTNKKYLDRAPPEVHKQDQENMNELKTDLEALAATVATLESFVN